MNLNDNQNLNRGLLLVYLVGFAFSCNYTNHAPLKDILMVNPSFGFDNARFGLLATGMFLTHALMQIPGGHLSDVAGARKVVLIALSIVILGNFGITFSSSYIQFISWKVFIGLGTGSSFIAGARYISQLAPAEKLAKAQAFYGASVLLGSGFVIFIVPIIVRYSFLGFTNWQSAFITTATVAVVVLICWILFAPHPPAQEHARSNLKDLIMNRQLWILGTIQMASFGLMMVAGNWITALLKQQVAASAKEGLYLGRYLQSSPVLLNGLASLVVLTGVVGRPLGGYLVNRTGVRLLLSVSFFLNTAACIILARQNISIEWIGVAILLLGTGCALPYASLFNKATQLFPGRAGAAKGLVNMLGVIFILIGTPLMGYIKDITGGFYTGFAIFAGLSFLVWMLSYRLKKS